jgi:uncharacterized lipoprotein YehR (DUF1307 family)
MAWHGLFPTLVVICGSMMAFCGSGLRSKHFQGMLNGVMIEKA